MFAHSRVFGGGGEWRGFGVDFLFWFGFIVVGFFNSLADCPYILDYGLHIKDEIQSTANSTAVFPLQ